MTDQPADRTKALDLLHSGVRQTLTSDTWKAALDFRNGFHRYSLNNCLLIQLQRPDATMVAGFNAWKDKGRSVRKGEKGIAILAPLVKTYTTENDEGEKVRRQFISGWRTVYVFDIEQTEGKEVPTTPRPRLLDGCEDAAQTLYDTLADYVISIGWTLDQNVEHAGAYGVCRPLDKSIGVRADVPKLQQAKTLAHEIAHALLHGSSDHTNRVTGELEAETAAYLVLNACGIDTSDYSFAYLANWTGDEAAMEDLISASARASKAADQILEAFTSDAVAATLAVAA